MSHSRRVLCFAFAFLVVLNLHAQAYTSIVAFGDSLTDTGNDAYLTQRAFGYRIPGLVADYADGRFTDGALTYPPSYKYAGVWVEQLAAMLPKKPLILNSLNGGTNYAYGFAETTEGTSNWTVPLPTDPTASVPVDNVGLQIDTYLATHPKISDKTLFVLWSGAIDVLYATSTADVINAAIHQALNVEQLIEAGATQFLIPNLPPLGATPRLNVMPSEAATATEASILFNATLAASLDIVRAFNRVSIYQLDVYTLFKQVIAAPASFGLVNVTSESQEMAVNPDTYLFWDDLHPTTKGHNILAITAAKLIAPAGCNFSLTNQPNCPNLSLN